MLKLEKEDYRRISFSLLLILLALLIKMKYCTNQHTYRSIIYFIVFVIWGRSINARLIQRHSRKVILFICFLIIFWLAIRMIKYVLVTDNDITRYLWYLFYIPILMIPTSWFLLSVSMGRPDNYRLEKKYYLVILISLALLSFVLTNDAHQKVFSFYNGMAVSNEEYKHEIIYFLIVAWNLSLGVLSVGILIYKSKLPNSNRLVLLPFLPISLMFSYTIGYICNIEIFREGLLSDMSIVNCLCIAWTIEASIHTGLIMVNTRYEEIFKASTISACIVDKKYNEYLVSDGYQGFEKEVLKMTEVDNPIIEGHFRLSSIAIRGGRVIWQEDVKELLEAIEELKVLKENLEESNSITYEEYRIKKKQHQIEEMNKLYTKVEEGTKKQIEVLSRLLEEFKKEEIEEEKIKILSKMALVGAYIKRKNNLVFISNSVENISKEEIYLSFKESMDNLEVLGVVCGLRIDLEDKPRVDTVIRLYDLFERVIEASIPELGAIYVNISDKTGISMIINIDINMEKFKSTSFLKEYKNIVVVEDDDGEISLRYRGD